MLLFDNLRRENATDNHIATIKVKITDWREALWKPVKRNKSIVELNPRGELKSNYVFKSEFATKIYLLPNCFNFFFNVPFYFYQFILI